MKFLVDRCAGRRLADWLSTGGHDSIYVGSLGPDPGDRVLLQRAVSEKRILVTIDTDFGRLVYKDGEVHCGIVRLPDVRCNRRIGLEDRDRALQHPIRKGSHNHCSWRKNSHFSALILQKPKNTGIVARFPLEIKDQYEFNPNFSQKEKW